MFLPANKVLYDQGMWWSNIPYLNLRPLVKFLRSSRPLNWDTRRGPSLVLDFLRTIREGPTNVRFGWRDFCILSTVVWTSFQLSLVAPDTNFFKVPLKELLVSLSGTSFNMFFTPSSSMSSELIFKAIFNNVLLLRPIFLMARTLVTTSWRLWRLAPVTPSLWLDTIAMSSTGSRLPWYTGGTP